MALFNKKKGNGQAQEAEVPEIEVRGEKATVETPEGKREVEMSKTKFA